jgi:hypothetical protein
MGDDLNVGESALLCLLSLMRHAFMDLTIRFAESDRARAERALHEIEATIVHELSQIRTYGFLGTHIDDSALGDIALELRDMTNVAREMLNPRVN